MTKIEPESLVDWLEEHKDEIEWVSLEWDWNETYEKYASFYGCDTDRERIFLYHRWNARRLDIEYSYEGEVEGAIEFANNYDCWDCKTLEYTNGVLIGRENGYDPDADDFPRNPEEMKDTEVTDIEYEGLFDYERDHRGNSHAYPYEGKTWIEKEGEE